MKIKLAIQNSPDQDFAFSQPVKNTIIPKGRRWGLTKGMAHDFIRRAVTGKFKRGLWIDVNYNNIHKYIERYFEPKLKALGGIIPYRIDRSKHVIHIRDAFIDFGSAEKPESIEGQDYDRVFVNEAGIVLNNRYLWDNAIVPMTWNSNASVIIGGTPKGRNLFHELAERGNDPSQSANFKTLKYTSFDSPYVNTEALREDMKSMPERVIKQEIYAEFLDDSGVVFNGYKLISRLQPQDPIEGRLYIIGCDLAKKQDYTVLTVFDRSTNNQVYMMRFNQLEWPYQKTKIKELSKRYNNAVVAIDSTGLGDPIADDLQRDGVPIIPRKFTNEFKKQIIEKLATWIEMQNITLLDNDDQKQELGIFTYDITDSGRMSYNAPVGFHDDIVNSLALAVNELNYRIVDEGQKYTSVIAKDMYNKSQNNDDEFIII